MGIFFVWWNGILKDWNEQGNGIGYNILLSCAVEVDNCVVNDKNALGVLYESIIGNVITNQDSDVDLSIHSSSRNSLEGNWVSVSSKHFLISPLYFHFQIMI